MECIFRGFYQIFKSNGDRIVEREYSVFGKYAIEMQIYLKYFQRE